MEILGRESRYQKLCKQIDALYAEGNRNELFDAVRELALHRLEQDEDAAQDTALVVLTSLRQYRGKGHFNAWVNGIINHRRSALIRELITQRQTVEFADNVYGEPEPLYLQYGSKVITDPFVRQVADLISCGYTQSEMAKMLGISLNALKGRLKRYRHKKVA